MLTNLNRVSTQALIFPIDTSVYADEDLPHIDTLAFLSMFLAHH